MKTFILAIILPAAFQGFGQKKKKADPKDIKTDSLAKVNSTLSVELDTVSKDQKVYYALYTTVKDKVLLHDFDPAKVGASLIQFDRLGTMRIGNYVLNPSFKMPGIVTTIASVLFTPSICSL